MAGEAILRQHGGSAWTAFGAPCGLAFGHGVATAPVSCLLPYPGLAGVTSGQEGEGSGPEDARACGQKILPSRLCCVSTLRSCQARLGIVALPQGTTVCFSCFSKLFSGEWAPVRLGGIYPPAWGIGTVSWAASGAGQPMVCCSGCSRPSAAILIWSICFTTAPLFRFTRKLLGQKGRLAPVHGPLLGRADNEDRGAGGRSGQCITLASAGCPYLWLLISRGAQLGL